MHVYVYDDYLNKGKYQKIINRLEIRLTDLGLNGKIIRLGGIKNVKSAIQNEIKLGAKTIVAVGNNQTVNKIIGAIIDNNIFGDFQKKTLLGIIPIGNDNSIAASFGIKDFNEACNILLARRVEKIDMGIAGEYCFLNQATIPGQGTTLELNNYSMEVTSKAEVKIINLLNDPSVSIKSNPHDGLLDIYIKSKGAKDQTYLNTKKLKVSNPDHKLLIDGVVEINTPVDLEIIKDTLSVIVGKDRMFE